MVYVTQEQKGKNLISATRFGETTVLLPPDIQVGLSCSAITATLSVKLSQFCDNDYLLLIGDPVLIGIASAIAASKNNGRVKFLKWDRMENRYYSVTMNIFEKGSYNA